MPGMLSGWHANFDSSVYESIPSFEAATGKFFALPAGTRDPLMRNLLAMLQEFGLQDIVGIDIKHKHFNMPEGHVLCEEQWLSEAKSIMKPARLDNISAMVPFNFALRDGKWKPYEFVVNAASAAERLEKVARHDGFLRRIADMVESAGLSDVLGFQVINRDHMPSSSGSLETPGEGENELLIRPDTEDMIGDKNDTKQVMWRGKGILGLCRHGGGVNCRAHGKANCGAHCVKHCKDHK